MGGPKPFPKSWLERFGATNISKILSLIQGEDKMNSNGDEAKSAFVSAFSSDWDRVMARRCHSRLSADLDTGMKTSAPVIIPVTPVGLSATHSSPGEGKVRRREGFFF